MARGPTGPWRGQRGPVVVSHQEHVCVLPKAMRLLASSPTVACEGLVHESLPIFSFQSHPEAVPGTARGFGLALDDAAAERLWEMSERLVSLGGVLPSL